MLARMLGTTKESMNHFMNRFFDTNCWKNIFAEITRTFDMKFKILRTVSGLLQNLLTFNICFQNKSITIKEWSLALMCNNNHQSNLISHLFAIINMILEHFVIKAYLFTKKCVLFCTYEIKVRVVVRLWRNVRRHIHAPSAGRKRAVQGSNQRCVLIKIFCINHLF